MIDPKGLKDDAERIADRLTVILGLTGLLKDGAFGAITERQSRALQETIETSEELKELLRPIFFDDKSFRS
jgi:hypothetical protein